MMRFIGDEFIFEYLKISIVYYFQQNQTFVMLSEK